MGKILDFTNLIGCCLPNINSSVYGFGGGLEHLTIYDLKKDSCKEVLLNIIPVNYARLRAGVGTQHLLNLDAGYIVTYRGVIITNKYVYPFYRSGDLEIEEIQVGHLTYKIEGNLWEKQE